MYYFENIIYNFHEDKIKIESFILFMFNDTGKSDLGKELSTLKICKSVKGKIKDESTTKVENKNNYEHIEVVASSQAGLGKTFYIKKKCKENNLTYIPFQIGGEVKRQTIMRRLKELKLEKNINYGLHLDFSDTRQTELFEDFIFSFLILKSYSNNENVFSYENNVKIFIEIPNGFFNFMDKFKLLNEFSIKYINKLPKLEAHDSKESFKDLEDIEYDTKNKLLSFFDIQKKNEQLNHNYLYKSDVQMVCNYLKFLNKMSSQNLYFYNLNEKLKDYPKNNYCDSEYIDKTECNKLLNKYFN